LTSAGSITNVEAGKGHGLGIGIQDDGPWYPAELRVRYERHLPSTGVLLDRIKNFQRSGS
jgi:hypothetical protein